MNTKPKMIGINVMSVVLAIIIWFIALSFGDPTVTRRIGGIKVNMENALSIESLNKIYSVRNDSDTISVNVRDRRSVVDSLKSDDFVATADLSKYNELGNVPIVVTCKDTRIGYDRFVPSQYSLQLDVEDLVSESFSIEGKIEGQVADGYAIEGVTVNPETVTVMGGQKTVSNIAKIVAVANVTGMKKDLDTVAKLTAYDANGMEIPADKIEYTSLLNHNASADVYVKILKTNKFPIKVVATGKLREDLSLEAIEVNPSSVEIKGKAEKIARTKAIEIKDPSINLSNITETFTTQIDIKKYIPKGVELADNANTDITVKVVIKKLDSITADIAFSDIELQNMPNDLSFELMGTGVARATVYGSTENLIDLNIEALSPRVNLRNVTEEKTYKLPLILDVPDNVTASENNFVYIMVHKKNSTEQPDDSHNTQDLNQDAGSTTGNGTDNSIDEEIDLGAEADTQPNVSIGSKPKGDN